MDRPFEIDPALTAIAIGYKNPASSYIADRVLPRMQVTSEKYKWTKYPLEESFNTPDARVGRTGRVQQLEFGGTEQTSSTVDYGLDSPIPNSDIRAAQEARERKVSAFDPEAHAVMMLSDTIANIREVRAAGIVFNAANYSSGRKVTLSGTSQLSDYTNSDPIGVIKTGLESTLVYRPNTMTLGRQVWSKLSSHPKIIKAIKGNNTDTGIVTVEEFLNLFRDEGLQEVLIGDSFYNTAKPGQNVSLGRAWGKHIALTYKNEIATPEGGGITFGFTAQYGSKIAGRIEDKDIGLEGGFRIRAGEKVKEEICAPDVGYLVTNAVA